MFSVACSVTERVTCVKCLHTYLLLTGSQYDTWRRITGYTYIKAQERLATGIPPGFTSRTVFEQCRLCGISAIWKKMPHKIYVASSNGAPKKIDPTIGTCIIIIFFEMKYSKPSLTTTLIWRPHFFLEKGPLILQKGAHFTLIGQFLELTLQCCGFFCFPQISNQISGSSVRRDQRFFRPYPRGLESLTAFVDVITKAALSSQLLKDPECWSGRYLNPRPPAQQTGALPTELTRQLFVKFFFILWEVVGKLQKEMFHASIGWHFWTPFSVHRMVRLKLLETGSIDYCLDINFCIRPRILNHVTFYFHVYVGTLTGIAMDEFRYNRREFGPFSNYPEFKFKIWDFGGQEDFYTTHQCFLSTLALYLLVWNLQEGKQKKTAGRN